MEKIFNRAIVKNKVEQLKAHGLKVGFTSGTFDILTAGHVDYLEKSKYHCDCLVVAVNSNISVKKYKGNTRPIVDENERIKVLSGLSSVDFLFLFDEENNTVNLREIMPHFYIKGGDYKIENIDHSGVTESFGIQKLIIEVEYDVSTTNIFKKICEVGYEKKL